MTTFFISYRLFAKRSDLVALFDSVLISSNATSHFGGSLLALLTWMDVAPEDFRADPNDTKDLADLKELVHFCGLMRFWC